ncbi:MAG: 4-hydroxybenzoate octaprenyltransferase [Burkholderiaceae bacterium]|jgi:4-hydroxybenzoate polyprenyltransferase|nr:4-hydroxybenzoate octaprenyltransferase [Burkholderiaceae bacterium]
MTRLRLYLDLIRWDRPAGWLLLLWPTLSALWLAAGAYPGWHLIAVFTLGTILMRSAGCCVNDVADRDFDQFVTRTANRPVTTGRISVTEALVVGAALALAAFGLVLTLNPGSVLWSFSALAIAILYPYAKRVVSMPQAVLGIAFSMGIPMAFVATSVAPDLWGQATGVSVLTGWLLLSNLFWVLAYDTVYAMVDRDDDVRLGIKTSALTLGQFDVAAVAVFYALHLGILFAVLAPLEHPPRLLALVIASAMAIGAVWHIRGRERGPCFWIFKHNHWLGLVVFLGIAVGDVWG